jgi:RNA polymerase sigma-70 factor, ECF subfamily
MTKPDADRTTDGFNAALVSERPPLYRKALFLSRDRDVAEDLTQETIARALTRRAQFRAGTNLGAWLGTILYNLFIDHRRLGRRMMPLTMDVEAPAPPPPERTGWLSMDNVRAAVATLPAWQRAIFELAYFERRSYIEIAQRFAIPLSTVGTRLLRTRGKVRRHLECLLDAAA